MKKIESYWWKILAVGIILIVAWKALDFSNVKSWIKSAFDIMMPFIIGAVLAFFTNKPSKAIEEFLKRKAKRLWRKKSMRITLRIRSPRRLRLQDMRRTRKGPR